MNIALFGHGRMGQLIEKIAISRGHKIVAIVEEHHTQLDYDLIDVAIDFSIPDAAFSNIVNCFKNNTAVISGTTGWLDRYEEAVSICEKENGAFIYASNFSLGVNLFFALNRHLAKIMQPLNDYTVALEEIHHTKKLDAPSGTAITLAEGILEQYPNKKWTLNHASDTEIPIYAKREGDVPGTHTVAYNSLVDSISIRHCAHNREGFGLGAVVAAEWIFGKKGVFSMKDVLNIG